MLTRTHRMAEENSYGRHQLFLDKYFYDVIHFKRTIDFVLEKAKVCVRLFGLSILK